MAYGYHKLLAVDHTKVSSDLTNFTVLIDITDDDLKTVANGGKVTNANGYDIVFSANSDGSSKYSHEIEKYDGSTGRVIFWVKLPSVSSTSDTEFYIVFGNSSITTSQEDVNGTWDATWKGVWHLNNNADDSSGNGNNLNAVNSASFSSAGKIAACADLETDSDQCFSMTNGMNYTGNMTVIAVINLESLPSTAGYWYSVVTKFTVGGGYAQAQYRFSIQSDDKLAAYFSKTGSILSVDRTHIYDPNTVPATGDWHFYVWRLIPSTPSADFWVDENKHTGTVYAANATTIHNGNANFRIGGRYYSSAIDECLDGKIDEVRFADTNLSDAYITATYYSIMSPTTFIMEVLGGTITADAVIAATVQNSISADAILSTTVSGSITADADIVGAVVQDSITADAVLRSTTVAQFTADAVLSDVKESTLLANAVLEGTIPASFTANAWLGEPPAPSDIINYYRPQTARRRLRRGAHT